MNTNNPYAPPRAVVDDAPELPKVRPRSVTVAVWMLWVEVTMSITAAALQMHSASDKVRFLSILISAVLFQGLSVLLNYKIWKGRNWARITFLILTLYGVLSLILLAKLSPNYLKAMPPAQTLLLFVGMTLDLVAIYLLFVPGRVWFRRRSAAA